MSDPNEYPWTIDPPEPTNLIALWPGDQPPIMTEVTAAFADQLGEAVTVVDRGAADDPTVLWAATMALGDVELAVWGEPARELHPDEIDDPAAAACRWIVGLESVLDPDEPLAHFTTLIRLLAGAWQEIPAILDVNTERWYPRPALDRACDADDEPAASVLWVVHVVEPGDGGDAWIHTHGLWRCSLPELEMIAVPTRFVSAGVELVETIAGRMLEEMLPPSDEPFAVGPDLDVIFQPWQTVAPADGLGGLAWRDDDPGNRHAGVRAVVCGAGSDVADRARWPQAVVECITAGRGAYFLCSHETGRLARRARAAWPKLVTVPLGDAAAAMQVLVKVGLAADDAQDEREHLWFSVRRFLDDGAEAQLLLERCRVAMSKGDVVWIDRQSVSDWTVVTPEGRFGPAQVEAMARALNPTQETAP